MSGDVGAENSETAFANRRALESMVGELGEGSVFRTLAEAETADRMETVKMVNPTTLCRVNLELGSSMSIPIWVYKKTSAESFPTSKKYSDQFPADDPQASHIVKRGTTYQSTTVPENDDVPPEDRVPAYKVRQANRTNRAHSHYTCAKFEGSFSPRQRSLSFSALDDSFSRIYCITGAISRIILWVTTTVVLTTYIIFAMDATSSTTTVLLEVGINIRWCWGA